MKIKDKLLDVRVHIGIALIAFVVSLISYISSGAENVNQMPGWGLVAVWVFMLILVINVSIRIVIAWIINPFLKLFTRNRK